MWHLNCDNEENMVPDLIIVMQMCCVMFILITICIITVAANMPVLHLTRFDVLEVLSKLIQ